MSDAKPDPALPATLKSQARSLVEGLGETALLDFLGFGTARKNKTLFTPERQLTYLRYLIRSGRIADAAAVANVSYETVRRTRQNDKAFAAAEEAAQALHNDMVRAMILERAEDGSVEDTWEAMMVHQAKTLKLRGDTPTDMHLVEEGGGLSKEMVLTKRVIKKSDAMLLAYAKSRMPEFREKGDVIANNASGGVLVVNAPGTTSEEWEKKHAAEAVEAKHEVVEGPTPTEKEEPGEPQ